MGTFPTKGPFYLYLLMSLCQDSFLDSIPEVKSCHHNNKINILLARYEIQNIHTNAMTLNLILYASTFSARRVKGNRSPICEFHVKGIQSYNCRSFEGCVVIQVISGSEGHVRSAWVRIGRRMKDYLNEGTRTTLWTLRSLNNWTR